MFSFLHTSTEAVGTSSNYAQLILDHLDSAVLILDSEGTILFANRAADILLGRKRKNLVHSNIHDLHRPHHSSQFEEFWKEVQQAESKTLRSMVFKTEQFSTPVRIRMERVQQEEETLFIAYFSLIPTIKNPFVPGHELSSDFIQAGIIILNEQFRTTYINQYACEILGIGKEELLTGDIPYPHSNLVNEDGTPLDDADHPAWKTLRTGQAIQGMILGRYDENPKDIKWLIVNTTPLYDSESDVVKEILVTFTDITDLKKTEKSIRESEYYYRSYIENAPVGIYIINEEGFYVDVNSEATRQIGYSSDEFTGKHASDHWHPEYFSQNQNALTTLQQSGLVRSEIVLRHKNGNPVFLLINSARLPDGRSMGFAANITEQRKAEDALLDKEADLKRAQRMAKVGSWRFDLTEGSVIASDEARRIYGFGEGDFSIRKIQEIPLPEYREKLDQALHALVYEGKPYDEEFRIKRLSDGKILDINSVAEFDRERNLVIGTIQDISERKRTEQALQESEEKHYSLSQATMEGIVITDRIIILETNQAACDMLGYSYDELIGMRGTDVLEESYREMALNNAMSNYDKPYEAMVQRKDGSAFWAELQGKMYHYRGNEVRVTAIRDITKRRQAIEALRASEAKYKNILDNSLEGIFIHQDKVIKFCNKRLLSMLGFASEEEALGTHIREIVAPSDWDRVQSEVAIRDRGDKLVSHYSFRMLKTDGTTIDAEALVSTIEFEGSRAYQAVIRDLSQQKRLEEQLQQAIKMESIGRLAGGIAHDFNNLLTAISGNAELANLSLNENDPVRSDIEEIVRTTQRASDLTRQLLAFSRKQLITPRTINLNMVLNNFEQLLRRTIGEDIALHLSLTPNLWNIQADISQVEQVLMNLVVNARDAMPEGGMLSIETTNLDLSSEKRTLDGSLIEPGKYVSISVHDTGFGMDRNTLDKVFEPFFTTKEVGQGTGLGLSTVYGIMRQNEGYIDVKSTVGKGTRFLMYFPMVHAEVFETGQQETELDRLRGTELIMVVEDDVHVRNTAVRTLRRFGYSVRTAVSGADALLMLEREEMRPDLILTDVVMPNMNGAEFSNRVREKGINTAILFMSGYTESEMVTRGVYRAEIPFLQKPFKPLTLVQMIRQTIDAV